LYQFTFTPTEKGSFSPKSSSTFVVICVIDDSYLDWSEMKSQGLLDLYFIYDQGCWAFLHVLIGHLYFVLLPLKIAQLICPSLHGVINFFASLVFWDPYQFWLWILCHKYSWQRFFSHSVASVFSLKTFSFVV
jgi:hypothetical protein